MKFQNILLLLTACLLAGSCSDDDNDGAWFLPRTLQVMDAKTDAPRANEPLTLNFIAIVLAITGTLNPVVGALVHNAGSVLVITNSALLLKWRQTGCIHFKGSTRGEYRAAFSYFPGTASDCFHSFRLDSGDEAPIIMTVQPLAKEFRSAIVITGMLADAKGSDTNNEYIQFMALEEIDFAQTPYCVIACRNNKVNAKGWVQGSYVTYKFNLTSGRAAKGTFFYVGGVNKRLNGNSSADISGANWICSVDYNTQAGADGIGDKTTGFLHNYNSNGNKNIADGIAVFKGTEVDEKSVPCDAVFYGATITTDVYNPAGYGYRIPDNDLYSTKNLLSGVGQPFFGQGTNTFLFPDGGNDAGEFVFFGGSFTQGGYYRGRSAVCRKLAADASGSLADIESGDGVTTYL